MVKTIVIIVVVLIVAVLIYAATMPDTFRIQRSATIKAPPQKIFAILNDFHRSESWSPYEKKDPMMKRTFSGAANGKGAVYEFDGNKEVGKGRLTITDTVPPSMITIALDIVEPFAAHNIVEYRLEPLGDATQVTWSMTGQSPYIAKVICLFMDMDRMVGKDFEVGLANLKAVAEA
ncbi:MAG TPA: SRPBCC family protein [Nitrospiraceae bacterium]|nr:SRPBCC family protein [Nitrospiraceae bacterium]